MGVDGFLLTDWDNECCIGVTSDDAAIIHHVLWRDFSATWEEVVSSTRNSMGVLTSSHGMGPRSRHQRGRQRSR